MSDRRSFLRGLATLPLIGGSVSATTAPDSRLMALANELEDLFRITEQAAETGPAYLAMIDRYEPLEREVAAIEAQTMAGIMAKVRAAEVPAVWSCEGGSEIGLSVMRDLGRLQSAALGRLSSERSDGHLDAAGRRLMRDDRRAEPGG